MTDAFEQAFVEVVGIEGGYSNHPDDPGGRTMWGITERYYAWAWRDGPPSLETAKTIYWNDFWRRNGLDMISSARVAFEVFEESVNVGVGTAGAWLQRAYNGTRLKGWERLKVDGAVGPKTIAAVNRLLGAESDKELVLLLALNCQQGSHYLEVENLSMIDGWMQKRVVLAA